MQAIEKNLGLFPDELTIFVHHFEFLPHKKQFHRV